MLAEPIIRLIFQYGRFDHHSTLMTSQALAFYALGLAAYASVKVTAPVFYNINETKYPVLGSFIAVAANVLVVWFTLDHLDHRALALSISCAMTARAYRLKIVSALVAITVLRKSGIHMHRSGLSGRLPAAQHPVPAAV